MNDLAKTLLSQLKIRQAHGPEFIGDPETIEVGLTPRQQVYTEGPHKLYLYPSHTDTHQPLFLIYSLINRPYIFDLRPGRSMIEHLCEQGFDVYLLDWGDPTPEMGQAHLSEMITGVIDRCVRKIKRLSHTRGSIDILGYCMGGTFAAMYAAYAPHQVRRLALLTPILGITETGALQKIARAQTLKQELLKGQLISGRLLKNFFNSVKPLNAIKKERDFWKNHANETFMNHFLPVEKWSNDTPDVPANVFFEFLDHVLFQNSLVKGKFTLNGHLLDFSNIRGPVFAVAADRDWIIPAESLDIGEQVFANADYTPFLIKGGHIGLVVGRSAATLWPKLVNFLR